MVPSMASSVWAEWNGLAKVSLTWRSGSAVLADLPAWSSVSKMSRALANGSFAVCEWTECDPGAPSVGYTPPLAGATLLR